MQPPPNVGTRADIPEDILRIAHIQSNNIVAWVTLDEEFQKSIGNATCCATFGLFVLPCFWPHLLILWPCLLATKVEADRVGRNTYWVLTITDIKVIVKRHTGCYSGTVGDTVKSIPLDSITDCGITNPDTGCDSCCTKVPSIYIDTASSGVNRSGSQHEAEGYGLAGYDWLVAEIIARRDTLKGHNQYLLSSPPPLTNTTMERDEKNNEGETVEGRLQKIKNLLNAGLLTEVEYEKKRQEIISSIEIDGRNGILLSFHH
jgi:hypothetical protein